MLITENKQQETGRIVFLDLLRIIACFFVIVNHTVSIIVKHQELSFVWFISTAYLFFSKAAVPVFLMISGYTMLNRQDTDTKSILRIFRYGCTLVLFSCVYFMKQYLAGEWPLNVRFFLERFLGGWITNAFWYMYLYLGILVMLPFLQKIVTVLSQKDYLFFFVVSALFYSVWPIVLHYFPEWQITEYFALPLFNSYIAMLLLGYYFRKYCKPTSHWRIPCIIGYIGSVVLNVFLTYSEYLRNNGEKFLFYDNRIFFPILFSAFCLFGFMATIQLQGSARRIVTSIGSLTFGVYLLSDMMIDELEFVYFWLMEHQMPQMAAMLIYEVCVFVSCAVITYILKKIPVLRKLL